MTIDERIEALTMNLELISHQQETQGKQIEALARDIEEIVPMVKDLVRVAEMHERRITRLEGPNP
jgi:hypothetical protein